MNTTIRGRKGEDLAAESYQKQGFTILKRNYRFGKAEVDIIAQKGGYTGYCRSQMAKQHLLW